MEKLINKYNVALPRYTSFPAVPNWKLESWTPKKWLKTVEESHQQSIDKGISLYIHLPFCEDLCTYCACNTRITKNHSVEKPYIEAVLKEWDMYVEVLGTTPMIKELHLGGGTPTFFNPENLGWLLESIIKKSVVPPDAAFSFEGHPGNTTKEHLKVLYAYGFKRMSLGIQDFNPEVQLIINRKQTEEQVYKVVQSAREIGYESINFDLVYGLPLQNLKSLVNTIEKVKSLRPDRIAFYSYAHVPWVKPGQRKFTEQHLPSVEEKMQLYQVGKRMLLDAGYLDVGMDHFSLPTDTLIEAKDNSLLHRNFMGYTDCHTQLNIALGVSSISDSWYGFAQNVKDVESYLEILSKGELPTVKGHILDDRDLEIRKIILDVMCKDRLVVPTGIEEQTYDILCDMESDGLIVFLGNEILITEVGKSFLRNIASLFDPYQKSKEKKECFSLTI